jgi:hypothetical protein
MTAVQPQAVSLFHGACKTHNGYGLGCVGYEELRRYYGDPCALCGNARRRMHIDHDHTIGVHAIRGLLCPTCNTGHMKLVDQGVYPIDAATREYLMHPYHLGGNRLPYEPQVHVALDDLNAQDRDRIAGLSRGVFRPYAIRPRVKAFDHEGVAACLNHNDIRPIMRLIWLGQRGLSQLDIADPTRGGREHPFSWPGARLYIGRDDFATWSLAERVAKRRRVSLSQLVIEALEEHLPRAAAEPISDVRWSEIAVDQPAA